MAIGDTLRPELIRSDTSGILHGGLAAGRSAERGLSEFGKAIAMGKRELDAKKQKRRDDEEAAQAILRMDASIGLDEARALAKHSAVRDFRDRLAAEEARDQAMALQRMQMDAMEDAARRLEEQEAGREEFLKRISKPRDTEETRELQEGFDAFRKNTFPKVMGWLERFTGRKMSEEDMAQWERAQAISEEARLAPTRAPSLIQQPSPAGLLALVPELKSSYAKERAINMAAAQRAIELEDQAAALEARKVDITEGKASITLTEGEKARDRAFGSEIVDYVDLGGVAGVDRNIAKLDKVIASLTLPDANLSGPEFAFIPDAILTLVNPEAVARQEDVEHVIQQSLRETLGAQFAEREGQQFLKRGYNPNLPEEENLARVKSLLKEISVRAKQKRQAFDYFNKWGTLKGYQFSPVSGIDDPTGTNSDDLDKKAEDMVKRLGGGKDPSIPDDPIGKGFRHTALENTPISDSSLSLGTGGLATAAKWLGKF